jgi:UDPglucose--hexose-1-phosphate uridylyltransferase
VRNKFPALSGEGPLSHTVDGVQHRMAGIGFHEVVVNHPHHNTTLALMQPWEIQLVLETLQHRGLAMAQDPRIQQVILFKNHGKRAGASLEHSHCQIIGMPVVPETVRRRSIELQRHYEATGEDPIQVMAEDELNRKERLVTVSDHFVGFVLYAALSPFHMWVVPRTKRASFLDVLQHELADLAVVLRDMMLRLHIGLNDPSYNIIIRSSPVKATSLDHFHWYISVVPRLSFSAGFELGSGMYINPSLPEASADFLRHVDIERVAQQA